MKNHLIIGDNRKLLDARVLPVSVNSIKMIYIDPPYNTQTVKSYQDKINPGMWKEMISHVLRQLSIYLKEDGVLFISIDDSEYATLKLACDKIFGKPNFIGTFITRQAQRSNSKFINTVHEYVLCYAKDKIKLNRFTLKRMDIPEQREIIMDILTKVKKEMPHGLKKAQSALRRLIEHYCVQYEITWLKNYNRVDENGEIYFASDLSVPGEPRAVDLPEIGLRLEPLKTRSWVSDRKFVELHGKNLLVFRGNRPYIKKFLKDAEDNVPSILNFYSRYGTNDLNKLGLRGLFDTPKPVELIKFLIRATNVASGEYVLDCYAGSGATAQAVVEVNQEDGKNIGFILIQKKEPVRKNNKIYKNCEKYGIEPYVSEITRLRLKKVYEKYNLENDVEYVTFQSNQ